jgi:hypothetical protein
VGRPCHPHRPSERGGDRRRDGVECVAVVPEREERPRGVMYLSALITLCRAVQEHITGPAIDYCVRRRSAWTE